MDTIPQDIPLKQCTKCKNFFPATLDFFSKKRNGLRSACKTCLNTHSKSYEVTYSGRRKQHYQEHREEKIIYCRQYYRTHKEECNEGFRQYYRTHKEEICAYQKHYNQVHSDLISKRNRSYRERRYEQLREQKSAYYKTDWGRMIGRAGWHRREVRKKAIDGTLTNTQIQTKLKAQQYACYYCFTKFEKRDGKCIYHLEHTVPISRTEHNPRHDINYVVLSCPACNLKKGTKLPHEWSEGGRLF